MGEGGGGDGVGRGVDVKLYKSRGGSCRAASGRAISPVTWPPNSPGRAPRLSQRSVHVSTRQHTAPLDGTIRGTARIDEVEED